MDSLAYTLTSPSGDVFALGTSAAAPGSFGLLDDSEGFGIAARDVKIASTAGNGGRLRTVRVPPRPGVLSVLVHGGDEDTLRANFRRLAAAVRYVPDLPLPKVTATFPSGDAYELPFLYESGAETGERFSDAIKVPLNVIFLDPFWTAVEASQFVVGGGGTPTGLLPDLAALKVAPSTASGAVTVRNPGDVPAYAVWTLTGPATAFSVTLGSRSWRLGPVAAGEVVTVDTKAKTALLANGTNVYTRFDLAPKFFSLPAGSSDLTVTIEGATATSLATAYYRPRLEVL